MLVYSAIGALMQNRRPNIASKAGISFFEKASGRTTLCIGSCGLGSGGCYSFAETIACELKADYIAVKYDPWDLGEAIDVFKERMTDPRSYKIFCIMGCQWRHVDMFEMVAKKYHFSGEAKFFVVQTPWMGSIDEKECLLDTMRLMVGLSQIGYKCVPTILTTGLSEYTEFNIGLPNPIPYQFIENSVLPKECLGLIYINELYAGKRKLHQLDMYFKKINNFAIDTNVDNPTVIAITNSEAETKEMIEFGARNNVTIIVKEKLASQDFLKALKEISQKGGLIICNGAQTLMQASTLECDFLFYSNKSCNDGLVDIIIKMANDKLKSTLKVILGVSEQFELLKNLEIVKESYQFVRSSLQASIDQFEASKQKYLTKSICDNLSKITRKEWKFDSKHSTAFTYDEVDESELTKLKACSVNPKFRRVKNNSSMWASGRRICLIELTPSGIDAIAEFALSPTKLETVSHFALESKP